MTRAVTILLSFLLTAAVAYAAGVTLFRAQAQGDSVHLAWEAAGAAGISGYDVYRQDYPADDFDRLVSLSPTAPPHYLDQNVYRTTAGRGPVIYRLDVRTATGLHTFHTTPAPAEESLMARSWDTIKLMFR